MRSRATLPPLVLLLAVAACSPSDESETSDVNADAAAAPIDSLLGERFVALVPDVAIGRIDMGDVVPGTDLRAASITYDPRSGDWPYGTALVLWREDVREIAALVRHDGDFGPHSVVWTDLDGDGRTDLWLLAGEEQVFESHAYLNRIDGAGDPRSALEPAYENLNDYSTLLDVDGDGIAEILDSGHAGYEHVFWEECEGWGPPDDVREDAAVMYEAMAGRFADDNFEYGMGRDRVAAWMLHAGHPLRLLSLRGGALHDVSREHPATLEHLRSLTMRMRDAATGGCRERMHDAVIHLDPLLADPASAG